MRPKVAFFDFASCDGCRLAVAESVRAHLGSFEAAEIVDFNEAARHPGEDYAISFVVGSVASESNEIRLKGIRQHASMLVAVGACAQLGGVPGSKSQSPCNQVLKSLYGDKVEWFAAYAARQISAVVRVDAFVPGCPIDRVEFIRMVQSLAQARKPPIPEYPVCVQCKMKEFVCVFHKGGACLGPVTRAGCGAVCIAHGIGCEGCRGAISSPNRNAMKDVLVKHGLTPQEALARMTVLGSGPIQQARAQK